MSSRGIAGGCAEHGTHSSGTFSFAYHESRLHGHNAYLRSCDSFQGWPESSGHDDEHPKWEKSAMAPELDACHGLAAKNGMPRGVDDVVPGYCHDALAFVAANERGNFATFTRFGWRGHSSAAFHRMLLGQDSVENAKFFQRLADV